MRSQLRVGLQRTADAAVALALVGAVASGVGLTNGSHARAAGAISAKTALARATLARTAMARTASARVPVPAGAVGAGRSSPRSETRCPRISARLGLHWPYSPFPENSAAAIEAAHRAGAPKVEVDVGFSRDGVPMVLHDDTIDRVTAHSGRVDSYTAARLQSFTLKVEGRQRSRRMSDQHILTVWDALTRAKADGMKVSVEIKPDRLSAAQVRAVAGQLARLNYWAMIDVRSFDPPVLAQMRRADRRIHTTLIVHHWVVPAPKGNVAESINFNWGGSAILPGVVRALHASGLGVDAYTPDTRAEFGSVPHSVDQITTNNVPGAQAYLKTRGC